MNRSTTGDDLRYECERYGKVRDVYIPLDYNNRQPRGFAFVEFMDDRDALDCIDGMDRKELDGRQLQVRSVAAAAAAAHRAAIAEWQRTYAKKSCFAWCWLLLWSAEYQNNMARAI